MCNSIGTGASEEPSPSATVSARLTAGSDGVARQWQPTEPARIITRPTVYRTLRPDRAHCIRRGPARPLRTRNRRSAMQLIARAARTR
jgi:hypothetical protein